MNIYFPLVLFMSVPNILWTVKKINTNKYYIFWQQCFHFIALALPIFSSSRKLQNCSSHYVSILCLKSGSFRKWQALPLGPCGAFIFPDAFAFTEGRKSKSCIGLHRAGFCFLLRAGRLEGPRGTPRPVRSSPPPNISNCCQRQPALYYSVAFYYLGRYLCVAP